MSIQRYYRGIVSLTCGYQLPGAATERLKLTKTPTWQEITDKDIDLKEKSGYQILYF